MRSLHRIMFLTSAIPALGFFSLVGSFLSSEAIMHQMALALLPAEYPNSEVVAVNNSGGTDSLWLRKTYRTTESIDAVLAFFEGQMSGFKEKEQPRRYLNSRCNESWLSRLVARSINEGRYPWYTADNVPLPCVSVSIYELTDHPGETYYEIWADWPAW